MSDVRSKDWHVETLRLSAFLSAPIDPINESLWENLSIDQPEVSHSHRVEQRKTEEINCLNGRLHLESSIDRYDLVLKSNPSKVESELPVFGRLSEVEEDFCNLVQNLLVQSPNLQRLAFGMVLLLPKASLSAANHELQNLLNNVKYVPENSLDFLYQINRRCNVNIENKEYKINRLANWSSVQISRMFIGVPISKPHSPIQQQLFEPKHACRLELDINTIEEFDGYFSGKLATKLFDKFIGFAKEIIEKGDLE